MHAFGANRRVRQFAQAAQLIEAPDGGENEKLPSLRRLFGLQQRAACGQHGRRQCRMRTARRTERQDQDYDGEEYAAYCDYPKNWQHGL